MDSTKNKTQPEMNINGLEEDMDRLAVVKNIRASVTPGQFQYYKTP